MKVVDDTFYVVHVVDERHVYDSEDDAIDHLREDANGVDPDEDDVSVAEVEIDGDDWKITELPWQQIALRLLQEN